MSAINEWFGSGYGSMFRYMERTYGEEELELFFEYLAKHAYSDITPQYRDGGLEAVRDRYCKNFRLDGGEDAVKADLTGEALVMEVRCPAYHNAPPPQHLDHAVGPEYCGWCRRLNGKILREAGYELTLDYDGCGHCRWEVRNAAQK